MVHSNFIDGYCPLTDKWARFVTKFVPSRENHPNFDVRLRPEAISKTQSGSLNGWGLQISGMGWKSM